MTIKIYSSVHGVDHCTYIALNKQTGTHDVLPYRVKYEWFLAPSVAAVHVG